MAHGKVLLIEDDAALRRIIARALHGMGFEVREAGDGLAGLEQQRHSPSDVVVTDVFMPHMDGVETTRAFRQEFPGVKIVATSGGWGQGEGEAAEVEQRLGADRFVKKPYTIFGLTTVINSLLPHVPESV